MEMSNQEKAGGRPSRSARRFFVGSAVLVLLAALAYFRFFHEPSQRVILPSGYTLVLREVVFAPENKLVTTGPFWNRWLLRVPSHWVPKWAPKWLAGQWFQASRSQHKIGGKQGFWIVEDLLPPDGPLPSGGPGSFHHEVVSDGEPYQALGMSGETGNDYVICNGRGHPLRTPGFRVRIFTLESGLKGRLLGEFRIKNPPSPIPLAGSPETVPVARTMDGLECELLRVELETLKPTDRHYNNGRLQLRLRERGIPVTNWAVAALLVSDPVNGIGYGVRNLGFGNGVLRVRFIPLWPDEPAWKLRLTLARTADFPASNRWALTVTNLPQGQISQRLATETFSDGGFKAVLAMPGTLELPDGTVDYILSPRLWVKASGATQRHQLRLVALTDQAGRPVPWKRAEWFGEDTYHWLLADENEPFDGGAIRSVTATFSWEPKIPFEFLVHPTGTTNLEDWPRRP